jgi:acetoin utilization deacetylase AcuC-like enzyme
MTTLLISHPACLNHVTPPGHPERPDRLRAIDRALENEKFAILAREQAPMAELESVALSHPMEYAEAIREAILDNFKTADPITSAQITNISYDRTLRDEKTSAYLSSVWIIVEVRERVAY